MADYVPTAEEFRRLAQEGYNLVPVYREVVADLETPVSAYLKITGGGRTCRFCWRASKAASGWRVSVSWGRSLTAYCGRARESRTGPATRCLRWRLSWDASAPRRWMVCRASSAALSGISPTRRSTTSSHRRPWPGRTHRDCRSPSSSSRTPCSSSITCGTASRSSPRLTWTVHRMRRMRAPRSASTNLLSASRVRSRA